MVQPSKQTLIAAISGGVDSAVMLDMLKKQNSTIVVAHVNHGIRPTSGEDERFVRELAKQAGMPFESIRLALGPGASEDLARQQRYKWLEKLREKYRADAIATAHHEDDILETIIINLLRGTGWRGLASLRETPTRRRPLLGYSKAAIISYAIEHGLEWREDETNDTSRYLRNRVRSLVVAHCSSADRQRLRVLYDSQVSLRQLIENETTRLYNIFCEDGRLLRYPLIMAPDAVSSELLRAWLPYPLETSRIRDLLMFVKTAQTGAKWSLDGTSYILASHHRFIELTSRD